MKRLPLMFLLAAGLAAATAQAQTVPEPAPTTSPTEQPAARTAAGAQTPAASSDDKRLSDARCLRETGSRITKRDGKPRCTGQPGRAYTKDDLNSTGHLNLSDALRTLDPSIR
jgi:hypothetical protein